MIIFWRAAVCTHEKKQKSWPITIPLQMKAQEGILVRCQILPFPGKLSRLHKNQMICYVLSVVTGTPRNCIQCRMLRRTISGKEENCFQSWGELNHGVSLLQEENSARSELLPSDQPLNILTAVIKQGNLVYRVTRVIWDYLQDSCRLEGVLWYEWHENRAIEENKGLQTCSFRYLKKRAIDSYFSPCTFLLTSYPLTYISTVCRLIMASVTEKQIPSAASAALSKREASTCSAPHRRSSPLSCIGNAALPRPPRRRGRGAGLCEEFFGFNTV